MPMVIVGVLLLVAKLAEFGPFGNWSWWIVLAPFGAAVLWWEFADSSGWTQRRVMDKMDERKAQRRQRAMEALGLGHRRDKQVTRAREDAARRSSADSTDAEAQRRVLPTTPTEPAGPEARRGPRP